MVFRLYKNEKLIEEFKCFSVLSKDMVQRIKELLAPVASVFKSPKKEEVLVIYRLEELRVMGRKIGKTEYELLKGLCRLTGKKLRYSDGAEA
jgi:hypothetical protein